MTIPLGTGPRILCVDDNREGLLVRAMFLEAFGFQVDVVTSGAEALRQVEKHVPDLVVLDYRMPGMDGGELAHRLKQSRPELPLLMLTGYTSEVPEAVCRLLEGVVPKGGDPGELLEELKRLTHWEPGHAPARSATDQATANHRHIAAVRKHLAAQRPPRKRA